MLKVNLHLKTKKLFSTLVFLDFLLNTCFKEIKSFFLYIQYTLLINEVNFCAVSLFFFKKKL